MNRPSNSVRRPVGSTALQQIVLQNIMNQKIHNSGLVCFWWVSWLYTTMCGNMWQL